MKKVFNLILSLSMSFGLVGCSQKKLANGEVTVLYTNDVHGYINNKVKNENDEEVDGLSYANVKALKDDLTSEGKNVLLVDAGDHTQGTAYSSMSEGIDMIDIMNEVGYDLATLGNHEFDYGQYQAFKFMDEANFDYVSCNFYTTEDNKLVLEPYKILEAGDLKIAFVGVSTPETISSSTPSYFQDEDGNYVYNFYSGEDGQELYDSVQSAIDEASKEADVVIGLGHLGVYDSAAPYRSIDVIENTTGLDAFIDGHSHTEIEGEIIQDKDGNDVVLTQTKSYLAYIGEVNITVKDGKVSVSTQLIDSYDSEDETVKEMEDKIVDQANEELNVKVADESVPFYISDPETGERLVRKMETNSGDITADAYYWYFNEEKEMECDVAINNGGGVRGDFPNGILTYGDCKTVMPFGNVICLVKVTGQTLLDALENGAISLPNESAIQHCAGMKYSVDTSIESTVQVDENGLWTGGPTGEYRVYDVEIYNRETGEYEPLDLEKTYTLAGNNYTLRNGGGGMTMLRDDAELVLDYVGEDYMIFADYLKSFTNNSIKTENSPLASYKNYLINYENLYGAGRITIE